MLYKPGNPSRFASLTHLHCVKGGIETVPVIAG